MRRFAQAVLLVLIGLGLLQTSLFTELYLRYVKEGMRPLLIASGALLLLLGTTEAWSAWRGVRRGRAGHGHENVPGQDHGHENVPGHGHGREDGRGLSEDREHGQGHGHDHAGVPRVAWLLFLPALSLLFYAPPALGSFTAAREAPKVVAVVEEDGFEPLPATSPLPITLTDFTQRVQQDTGRAIEGRTVRMTGFVTPADGGDGWYLTRILLSCCAADAQSVKVRVYGVEAPAADTWVTVTGTWHPGGTLGTESAPVALDARGVEKVERPTNGYTDALPIGS
ncbi:TIGR03943 family putative permease subunit [Streptomyces sp. NPDC006527]|uniref:TIGR03943 family putative permease subunit n=1 Tax=Streptomyces sp. NPDC006527 TaxID=3364749 RepID=UPI00368A5E99